MVGVHPAICLSTQQLLLLLLLLWGVKKEAISIRKERETDRVY